MRIDVLTIFPEAFASPLEVGLLGKAIGGDIVRVKVHDLRDWAEGPHRKVDDMPFGGGPGMVMTPGPIVDAVEEIAAGRMPRVLLMSAAGRKFDHRMAEELAKSEDVVIICGRYEGVDQRVVEVLGAEEVSVGDFVLAGGEVAALLVIEATARLIPGFMGNERSLGEESYAEGMLEYPQYTRPAQFRGLAVPEVLISGDHGRIAAWRKGAALDRTRSLRPDLLAGGPQDPSSDPEGPQAPGARRDAAS